LKKFESRELFLNATDGLSSCLNLGAIIELAAQELQISLAEFVGTSFMPFSFITAPYVEKKIVFDLETTGFGRDCEILQIALVDLHDGKKYWNQYVQPKGRIDPRATQVNQLSLGINGKLCYRGIECRNVLNSTTAIKNLRAYLKNNYPEGAILIAHNGDTFDFPVLRRYFETNNIHSDDKEGYSITCIDSMRVFRKHFGGLSSYKQEHIVKRFPSGDNLREAHDALGDCLNLRGAIHAAAAEKRKELSNFLGESMNKQSIWSF